jgi:4-hydroxybenzoate polyprenyltransferase
MAFDAVGGAVAGRVLALPLVALEAMRPRQWTKNAFVLAGVVFAGELLDPGSVTRALVAFTAFCLASGATYLLNDVRDAEGDRRNPRTAGRPIARGALDPQVALVVAAAAALGALALAATLNLATVGAVLGYLALQVAYSAALKRLLLVDAMAVAAGFVLRAFAGGTAIEVAVSPWLLLCTGGLALFLAFVKRRGELVGVGSGCRPALEGYTLTMLDQLIGIVAPATVVVYAIYTVLGAATDAMALTVPFVVYGLFRVLVLVHHHAALTEDPSEVVWRDGPLLACVLLWGACAGAVTLLT